MSTQVVQFPSSRAINKVASKRQSIFGSGDEGIIFNYQTVESQVHSLSLSVKVENFLSHRLTAWILTSFIVIYSILVVIRIAFESEIDSVWFELDILELVFLTIFVIEVCLRIFAYKSVRVS
jgi:hypothetical protein